MGNDTVVDNLLSAKEEDKSAIRDEVIKQLDRGDEAVKVIDLTKRALEYVNTALTEVNNAMGAVSVALGAVNSYIEEFK